MVTDSTSDIRQEDAERAGITVVPAYVFFGEEQFRDGVSISGAEFYRRLEQRAVVPKTAQPSPQDFADAFSALAPNGPVLALTVSSKMSGTYNSALIGRDMTLKDHPDAVIEVVDSLLVAMGLGILAQAAAEKARGGANIEEIAGVGARHSEQDKDLFRGGHAGVPGSGRAHWKGAAFPRAGY